MKGTEAKILGALLFLSRAQPKLEDEEDAVHDPQTKRSTCCLNCAGLVQNKQSQGGSGAVILCHQEQGFSNVQIRSLFSTFEIDLLYPLPYNQKQIKRIRVTVIWSFDA
ncbi:hypothetical protein M0R45_028864 [Rubus argutus]|uniref:Uncharacterized protein n=1 Tax=Rubus argutus TaxID=59490 RepID=A0AAW1W7A8_RUBAR